MDLGLQGQVAVVVGGANGIGRGISAAFAAEGAHVAVLDVTENTVETAVQVAEAHGVRTLGTLCDIASFESVERSRDAVLGEFRSYAHVVVVAAIGSGKFGFPFLNLQPSDWDRVLQVNILGTTNVAHVYAPHLMERQCGTVTLISSVAGQIGSQTDPPYSASKAANINFAQCMARDLAPHQVRVNTVCPGMVKTSLNELVWKSWNDLQPEGRKRSYEDWAEEKVRNLVPLRRWQEPADIGAMVVFLASKRAQNVTGQTINVDGGYVIK